MIRDPHTLDTWPTEPTGIIEPFRGTDFFVAPDPGSGNPIRHSLVIFDEPHDDGSGDGPYTAATIDEFRLQPIGEAELDTSAEGEERRALIDATLREAIERPDAAKGCTEQKGGTYRSADLRGSRVPCCCADDLPRCSPPRLGHDERGRHMNLFVLRTWLQARFGTDEEGTSMVEYILLVALIALAVIAAVVFLSDQENAKFNQAGSSLSSAGS